MGARKGLDVVSYGEPAVRALAGAITQLKEGDPLAPVTVVMPSTHAGVTVRRHLVRKSGALVNVQFVSFPQLAGVMAGPVLARQGRQVLTPVHRAALIRTVLRAAPAPFGGFQGSAIEASLEATFAELDQLDDGALDRQAAVSERSRAVIELYRCFRDARGRDIDDAEGIVAAAIEAVRDGSADLAAIGSVVVHLPRRLTHGELDLVRHLAGVVPLRVQVGVTGVPAADVTAERLVEALEPVLSPPQRHDDHIPETSVRFVRAPDPEEEVRAAIRVVLDALERVPPERIALASRVADPYVRLLSEQLQAAGIPFHAPAAARLSQTAAGRALVGMLALPRRGFRRAELSRWLASAPLRGPSGERVRVGRIDRIARRAGVSSGVERWRERLGHRRAELRADRAKAEERGDADALERVARNEADVDELAAFFEWLVELTTPPEHAGWSALASWADAALVTLLGKPGRQLDWPDHERASYEAVRAVLEQVGALDDVDDVDGTVTPELFARVVLDELERPARSPTSFGKGVFVGGLADLVGGDHDLAVVLGMAETRHPPRGADDPVLPDRERQRAGDLLPARRPSRADEHRDHLAALASARKVVLSFARADTRAGREQLPSRWWLDALASAAGRRSVGVADLADVLDSSSAGQIDLVDLPSFVAAPAAAATATTAAELRASLLLHARGLAGRDGVLRTAAALDASLGRSAVAVRDRVEGRFTEWTGRAGHVSSHDPTAHVASATRYEQYAVCPYRYFLRSVLEVGELDERGEADSIGALDRGSLVHEVLERFHAGALGRDPVRAFDDDDRERLRAIVREVGEEFQDQGVTGRPLLWELAESAILRRLGLVLEMDEQHRRTRGVSPRAVELAFGYDEGEPPVTIELADGRAVVFRGSIDRIDVSPDGTRVVVFDYKTGKTDRYKMSITDGRLDDVTWRGTKLQLAIYGEAARRFVPTAQEVEGYYWFVDAPNKQVLIGGPIGEPEQRRLREVLGTVVAGIDSGRFPPNPGAENAFLGFDHCRWCAYSRICPQSRGDQWEQLRTVPELAAYVELAEGSAR